MPGSTVEVLGALGTARESSALLDHPDALRAEFDATGYLLFRSYLPVADVEQVATHVRTVLEKAGWPRASEADNARERGIYRELLLIQVLHELPHHPRLVELMATVLATDDVLVHPHPACRFVPPSGASAGTGGTPAHQDSLAMQGSTRACTAWLPLAPCPMESGPLVVAAGSHRALRPYKAVAGARVLACDDGDLANSWVGGELDPGDVLIFSSLTVHRALANRSPDPRLSLDFRFQPSTEPICEVSIRENEDLPWSEIYRSWSPSPVRYFWERLDLDVVAFDPTLGARNDR